MSRRIEVELTSARDDSTWTWRAAGAREPKGVIDAAFVPKGATVGQVLRVEADFTIDGITIQSVLPPKAARAEPELLEIVGGPVDDRPVVTKLAPKRGKGRDKRGDRKGRGKRGDGEGRAGRRDDREPRGKKDSGDKAAKPRRRKASSDAPARPKSPRLRPKRTHRDAVLAELPDEQRLVAEQVLKGGVPAVRDALEKQNAVAREAGQPEVPSDTLIGLAEKLQPTLKAAEWRDRAEAALATIDEVDVRDIRSVVVAADTAARDEASRALAEQLQQGLVQRVDNEHRKWLDELAATLKDGRAVRALRLSSRPPKAGAPLPPELATQLVAAAEGSLTAETSQQRWATVVDAVAYSPVRTQVTPQGTPAEPGEELLTAVRKVASRVPDIAATFGITPAASRSRKRRPPKPPAVAPTPPESPPGPAETITDSPAPAEHPEPASEPVADAPEPEPAPEPAPEPVADAPEPEPAPEPAAEPVADAPEPEPVSEPVADAPEPEPAPEPASEPVADAPEPEPEPAPEPAAEPVADAPEPEPVSEPVADAPESEPAAEPPVN